MESDLAFNPERVLFVGIGTSAVAWYRAVLPAMFMGADWIGVFGDPPDLVLQSGLVKRETGLPQLDSYDIVVIQQPGGRAWLHEIRRLQSKGVRVLYEIDDYVHAIKNQRDHDWRDAFDKKRLAEMEACMRVCDGLIASTEYVARRYRAFNKRVFVCENGLDTARYRLTVPSRPATNIGWAGATAHREAFVSWLPAILNVMRERDDTCFVSIGQPFAHAVEQAGFEGRAIATPFTFIETYPAAMCMFDIALAPAGRGNFHKGKSDLRWLEASALGIPVIADPVVYPKIEHGVTGFHASDAAEAEGLMLDLIDDPELRQRVGAAAREYVLEHRDMRVAVRAWARVFNEVIEEGAIAA